MTNKDQQLQFREWVKDVALHGYNLHPEQIRVWSSTSRMIITTSGSGQQNWYRDFWERQLRESPSIP